MEEMAPVGDFPGGPVGKTPPYSAGGMGPSLFREPRSHTPAWHHQKKKKKKGEMAVVMVGSPPPLLHPSPLDQVSRQGSLRPMATKMLPGWLLWLVSLALATRLPKCVSGRVRGSQIPGAQRGFQGWAACWDGSLFTGS